MLGKWNRKRRKMYFDHMLCRIFLKQSVVMLDVKNSYGTPQKAFNTVATINQSTFILKVSTHLDITILFILYLRTIVIQVFYTEKKRMY